MFIRRSATVAALVGFSLLAAACGSSSSSTDTTTASTSATPGATTTAPQSVAETTPTTIATVKPVSGGKLVVGIEAETTSAWDPASMQCAVACYTVSRSFFESLVALDANGKPYPYLAKSIDHNADYTEWTIGLRDGITFSDGSPLNADAAIVNLNRQLNSFLVGSILSYVKTTAGAGGTKVGAFEKVDDKTIKVTLSQTWTQFPNQLSNQVGYMASPAWLAKVDGGDKAAVQKPIGTGPFMVDSYKPGDTTTVKRNPTYWRKDASGTQLPYLDEVDFKVVEDYQARADALEAGNVDVIHTTSGATIKQLRTEKDKFNTFESDNLGESGYILLNVGDPKNPLSDQRVRCGLAAATPRKDINDALNEGVFQVSNGPFNPSQPGYLADNGYVEDPAKAAALIADYTKEKGAPPKIIYSTATDSANLVRAQIVKSAWEKAGAKVDIQEIEQGKLITNALIEADDFYAFGWRNHGGYFDDQFRWWSSTVSAPKGKLSLNFGRLSDPVIDKDLADARKETDPAKIKALAEDVNREIAKQCWLIPNYWIVWAVASQPNVQGIDTVTQPDDPTVKLAPAQGFSGSVPVTEAWLKK